MWIFLLILKWIFIILGILLGLVLLFTALVLCVPVRYRAAGDNHEKIQYSFKVSWLLSIVAVKKKKDSEQIVFSVFGIPIKRMGNEKPVKKTVVKSEKEKEPEPLQDNKEETGEPVLAAQEEKKEQRKDKKKRTFFRTQKAKKMKSKKNFSFQGLSSIMKCVKQNKKLLKRLIGFILFWIGIGMCIMLFMRHSLLAILIIIACLVLGYNLFTSCD